MFKKALSVLMALIMVLGVCSVAAFAKTSEEADTHLQYNTDGKFRIMQISDIQDNFIMRSITKKVLKKALDTYPVDLIVLTGDNISSTSLTKLSARLAIDQFMSILEDYGIPVVMTFGNHDDENTLATKEYQVSIYEKYDCFVGCAGEDLGDTNLATYFVPIYSSTNKNKMVSNIWMMDSGTYNTETESGGYAATTKAQIEWYKNKSAELEEAYGRKIPSLMFQHIIVPEIWDALEECEAGTPGSYGHDGKAYKLPEGTVGELNETPCPPNYNNGQFDAVLERGDVMAMFFGHDHTNSFELNYKGVGLINTPGIGFNSYNGWNEGVRIITLDENDPWSFETESVGYFDLYDYDDDVARYEFKIYSSTSDSSTQFACVFKYMFAYIEATFKNLFGIN